MEENNKLSDRVKPFLIHRMEELTFDEFSPSYISRLDLGENFAGVPVPLRDGDREAFAAPEGLPAMKIAGNMAFVLGVDPGFKHADAYIDFITRLLGEKAAGSLSKIAESEADLEKYEDACVWFRAALVFRPDDLTAMYGYAVTLGRLYSNGKSEEYVGFLKAECIEYFEMITVRYPDFDMAWYFLGYMYLNLGLYTKAKLAWVEYLKYGVDQEEIEDIEMRVEEIEEPVEIERGCNAVLSGRWEKGIEILEPFMDEHGDWWPLWYHLGVAYAHTDRDEEAENAFKKSLKGSPRNIESMEGLLELYTKTGNKTGMKKYRDKLELIKKPQE